MEYLLITSISWVMLSIQTFKNQTSVGMISQVEKRGIVKTILIIFQKGLKSKNRHNAVVLKM